MLPSLTEDDIRCRTDAGSFQRGTNYYRRGAIINLTRQANELWAECAGSRLTPYRVTVTLGEQGIVARIDTILEQRFGNWLPMDTVRYFYDHLETSVWESRKPHPLEELPVSRPRPSTSSSTKWLEWAEVRKRGSKLESSQ